MKISMSFLLLYVWIAAGAQTNLTISGQTYTNSSDTWSGVNIPRSSPTRLVFKNNTISSTNRFGYLLQAGDEAPAATNNNLDDAVITGNRLNWSGSDMDVIPHGIFAGHNRNVIIKYNYLNYVPMGIIQKSGNNMSNSGGGVAYNIVKGGAVAMVVKGMSNVNIYNNTFYTDRTTSQTWRPLLHIYTNTDNGRYSVAHGTRVFNNIFYTKYLTPAITVQDEESLTGFQCDYNVYWCENGAPLFIIDEVQLTFAQWQARGYDTHSVVMNPNFRDLVNFVPSARINRGTDLGSEWAEGLAVGARWGASDPETTAQNGPWQVGAVVHGSEGGKTGAFEITQAVLTGTSPTIIEVSFTMGLEGSSPDPGAFTVNVNSTPRTIESVAVSGDKIILAVQGTINVSDKITVSYNRPATNPLRSTTGLVLESFTGHQVINNLGSVVNIYPNPARRFFNISNTGPDQLPQVIRLYDLAGRLCFEKKLESEFMYRVPINLPPGVYVLYLEIGTETKHSRKLIVIE